MRSWEKLDITDILKEHHTQLIKASVGLGDGGDYEASNEQDDKAIVIEQYLEEAHSIEWDGLKFITQEKE